MAYAMALRSATVPTLDAYGRYVGQPRTYIDSTVITHQLKVWRHTARGCAWGACCSQLVCVCVCVFYARCQMFVEHRRHVHDTSVLEIVRCTLAACHFRCMTLPAFCVTAHRAVFHQR